YATLFRSKVVSALVCPQVDEVLFDAPDPAVQDVAQGPPGASGRAEPLHDLTIELVELVKMQIVVRNHDEARDEAFALGVVHRQVAHEGLAATVAASQKLHLSVAFTDQAQHAAEFTPLGVDSYREGFDAALGHRSTAQCLKDVFRFFSGKCHQR